MGGEFWEEYFANYGTKEKTLKKLKEDVYLNNRYFKLYNSKEEKIKELKESKFDDMNGFPTQAIEALKIMTINTIKKLEQYPEPKNIEENIKLQLELNDAEGTKSPLDFDGFSEIQEMGKFQILDESKMINLLGTNKPSKNDIEKNKNKIAEHCNRLIGLCIPIYDSKNEINEYYFCAYSAD